MQHLAKLIKLLDSVNVRTVNNEKLNMANAIEPLLKQKGPEVFKFNYLTDFRQPAGSGHLDLASGVRLATAVAEAKGLRFDIVGLSDPEIERNFRNLSDMILNAAKNAYAELSGLPIVSRQELFLQRMKTLGVTAPNDELLTVFMNFGLAPIYAAIKIVEDKASFALKEAVPDGVLNCYDRLHVKLLPERFPDPITQLSEIETCFVDFFNSN